MDFTDDLLKSFSAYIHIESFALMIALFDFEDSLGHIGMNHNLGRITVRYILIVFKCSGTFLNK